MEQGIDVSRYQGQVNWQAVRQAGITFAILRAGFGRQTSQKDPTFEANYAGATAAGLRVGAYWYSYAADAAGVQAEARACLEVLADRSLPMGIWFDQEYEPAILALSNAARTALVQRFLTAMRAAGYKTGLYCSADWLRTKLVTEAFADENLWVAQYASRYTGPLEPHIWQYTESGRVNGVTGNVDRNELLRPLQSTPTECPPPSLGSATLRPGAVGPYVSALQQMLSRLGYYTGPISGNYDAATEAAVRDFQQAEGLTVDGIAGTATKTALTAAWQALEA